MLSRNEIINAIVAALEPQEFAIALWEGGSAAFGRLDEWSDIDIMVDAEDEFVPEVFETIEPALEKLARIDRTLVMPEPAWHGLSQRFYHLEGTPDWLMIDTAVVKHSNPDKFLEPELHGRAVFHFNKNNAVTVKNLDIAERQKKMKKALENISLRFDFFSHIVEKKILRGFFVEAVAAYHQLVLQPLVTLLRMKHDPARFDFSANYLHYDLPSAAVSALEDLYRISSAEELSRKNRRATEWFTELRGELERLKL